MGPRIPQSDHDPTAPEFRRFKLVEAPAPISVRELDLQRRVAETGYLADALLQDRTKLAGNHVATAIAIQELQRRFRPVREPCAAINTCDVSQLELGDVITVTDLTIGR